MPITESPQRYPELDSEAVRSAESGIPAFRIATPLYDTALLLRGCCVRGGFVRFAYADPPYVGQAKKHYADDPQCAEVDHGLLIERLVRDYPDGWALSLSSPSLQQILALCPPDARVGAWVKPFAAFKVNVNPAYAWEPIIFRGGRKRERYEETVRDWVSTPITLRRGTHGAKPEAFCFRIFQLLGMRPSDTLDDLFPGSGAVATSWGRFCQQQSLWGGLPDEELA